LLGYVLQNVIIILPLVLVCYRRQVLLRVILLPPNVVVLGMKMLMLRVNQMLKVIWQMIIIITPGSCLPHLADSSLLLVPHRHRYHLLLFGAHIPLVLPISTLRPGGVIS
jgi:hypothetical protein